MNLLKVSRRRYLPDVPSLQRPPATFTSTQALPGVGGARSSQNAVSLVQAWLLNITFWHLFDVGLDFLAVLQPELAACSDYSLDVAGIWGSTHVRLPGRSSSREAAAQP